MEISTKLYPRGCFLSGETVACAIQFYLPRSHPSPVCVAWASAQLQCECDQGKATEAKDREEKPKKVTSFRSADWTESGGAQIMSSAPKVINAKNY